MMIRWCCFIIHVQNHVGETGNALSVKMGASFNLFFVFIYIDICCLRRFDLSIHTLHRCNFQSTASRDWLRPRFGGRVTWLDHGSRWAIEGFHHLFVDQEMIRRHRCSDDDMWLNVINYVDIWWYFMAFDVMGIVLTASRMQGPRCVAHGSLRLKIIDLQGFFGRRI